MIDEGSPMPDFAYRDANGREHRLSESWHGAAAWLLWLRHCGCQFYQEAAADLRDAADAFAVQNVRRVCIVQADAEEAGALCSERGSCDLCVPDPERRTFALAGLGHAKLSEVLFPSEALKLRRAEAKRRGVKQDWARTFKPGNDAMQLPGAALVDEQGIIRYLHSGVHTGDLPSSAELLRIAGERL